jgi:hypothetical protein
MSRRSRLSPALQQPVGTTDGVGITTPSKSSGESGRLAGDHPGQLFVCAKGLLAGWTGEAMLAQGASEPAVPGFGKLKAVACHSGNAYRPLEVTNAANGCTCPGTQSCVALDDGFIQ